MTEKEEKQQILTLEELESENIWYFCLKNNWNNQNSVKHDIRNSIAT